MPTGVYKHKKGYKRSPMSKEWKKKLGLVNKGRKRSEEFKKKVSQSMKGVKKSLQMRERLSKARKGKPVSTFQLEQIRKANAKRTPSMLGKKHSLETIAKMRATALRNGNKPITKRGAECWNWKGGISPLYKRIRRSKEFMDWREAVFKRDDWTCQGCGIRGGILHPDHIKPFAFFPELRFELSNGRTLCKNCHVKTDSWGHKATKNYGKSN